MSATEHRWYDLRNAVGRRDFPAAEELLRMYPGLLMLRNSVGETALHYLAVENDAEGVAWLHQKGSDLDTKCEFGTPILFQVAQLGYMELFTWFLLRGANVRAVDEYDQGLVAFLTDCGKPDMARIALTVELGAAFAGLDRDQEQSLHQAQLTDQSMSREIHAKEWSQAGRLDGERSWIEVPGEALEECDAALSHFTPASWRFYLPAYLCRSLSLFVAPAFKAEMLQNVLFQLTCRIEDDDGMISYLLERFQSLNPAQIEAVRHFLELVVHESLHLVETTNDHWQVYDSAKTALDSYWSESASR